MTEEAIGTAPHLEYRRTPADRFVRRLLGVSDVIDRNAIFGARRSTTTAIVLSGIRCTITYLVIPIVAPFIGLLDTLDAPISIGLSSTAIVMGITGLRRFWMADHRARWSYTAFIGSVLVMLSVAIAFDVSKLVNS